VLETGRLVLDGTAEKIASDEGVRRSYLGMV
jgi:ABC-type branched-subunit amino acid transport system ATPase component